MVRSGKSNKNSKGNIKSWKSMGVSGQIHDALKEIGFLQPTQIQALTIPAAIGERRDIIGAAETGSGKTLAFAIPIIDGILKDAKKDKLRQKTNEDQPMVKDAMPVKNETRFEYDEKYGKIEVIDNIVDLMDDNESVIMKPLRALIVTPTRELAVQIKQHFMKILSKTKISCEAIIGGMSAGKQERLLATGPEIVIGTPGRLFQLIDEGNPHLSQLSSIRYLAIDETDRMMEKGHFEELHKLLHILNTDPDAKSKRQTFVFSATLSLVHDIPKRLLNKSKKTNKVSGEQKVSKLMRKIGVRENAKIVDVTPEQATAARLTESKIFCAKEEKELYLYYFIKTYPGRTLVFCNSINCVRRLYNVFGLLECNPKTLHSSKNQKQRLNSLEKFTSKDDSILFATDVAARGLDIPRVKYIVHYEVPRTAESYVHRSGRTARAAEEGLSVMLIEPADVSRSEKICKTLKKVTELANFPINQFRIRTMRQAVNLAKKIETSEHTIKNSESNQSWEQKMAKAADLPYDSDGDDEERSKRQMVLKRKRATLQTKRYELKNLLVPHVSEKFNNYSFQYGVIGSQDNNIFVEKDAIAELPKKKLKIH